jgi:hypothetical protein
MTVMQNVNIFLPLDMYRSVKALGHQLDMPYVKLIREGISLVLERHKCESVKKA